MIPAVSGDDANNHTGRSDRFFFFKKLSRAWWDVTCEMNHEAGLKRMQSSKVRSGTWFTSSRMLCRRYCAEWSCFCVERFPEPANVGLP